MKRIYLDHAAATAMRPAALHAMERALEETWGNAGAIYAPAAAARKLLEDARGILAESIGAERREIYFTSGGTESDNWALVAAAEEAARSRGERPGGYDSQFPDALSGCGGKGFIPDSAQMPHIITTAVEHHAVLETCNYLERRGFAVTRLPVDAEGIVTPGAVLAAMRPATCLVSVMAVNNEIGTMEPVSEISEAIRQYNKERRGDSGSAGPVLFHIDAVQAYGRIALPPCDLMSVSAHKIGGPKGIGFLYVRSGVPLGPFVHGGLQERGRRAGTENVPAAAGFAAAALETMERGAGELARETELRNLLWSRLQETVPGVVLNGAAPDSGRRIGSNLNVSIPGMEAETMLILLDMEGICAAGGSACTTGALEPSHVLRAIGADRPRLKGALRFTLGPETTREEIMEAAEAVRRIVLKNSARSG